MGVAISGDEDTIEDSDNQAQKQLQQKNKDQYRVDFGFDL